jgi:5-methylcytosine-specific restriction endonuclease McrA
MDDLKRCCYCKETKPLCEFNRNRSAKDGFGCECRLCLREKQSEYRQANREELARKQREYYANHKEQAAAYGKAYRQTHPEKVVEQNRKKRAANPELYRAHSRNQYYRNKVRALEIRKRYRDAHPEVSREAVRRRRKRLKEQFGITYVPRRLARLVLGVCGTLCLKCGTSGPITIDHVIPISRGGTNDPSNLQPLCDSCNKKKHTATADYRTPTQRQRLQGLTR